MISLFNLTSEKNDVRGGEGKLLLPVLLFWQKLLLSTTFFMWQKGLFFEKREGRKDCEVILFFVSSHFIDSLNPVLLR